jgi:predicted dithiol-disulfide oxidoreductase (DUF899 family)
MMTTHTTGTREQWLARRLALLKEEKELTRRSDELARRRQELPWVRIDKDYRFDTEEGSASLLDLFRGRSQLLVYHFMFGPDMPSRTTPDGATLFAGMSGTDKATYTRERPGLSALILEDGIVYHTYSAYARASRESGGVGTTSTRAESTSWPFSSRLGDALSADARTAWRHGVRLGLDCGLCCANLMVILLVL